MEYVSMVLIVILFTIFSTNISELHRNQKRIESKLDKVIEHLGLYELSMEHISADLKSELIGLVSENKRVKAIKKLRDATGMGLKEAKDYVDSL